MLLSREAFPALRSRGIREYLCLAVNVALDFVYSKLNSAAQEPASCRLQRSRKYTAVGHPVKARADQFGADTAARLDYFDRFLFDAFLCALHL